MQKETGNMLKTKLVSSSGCLPSSPYSSNRSRSKVVLTAVKAQSKATYDLLAQTDAEQNKEEDIRYYQSVWPHTEEYFACSPLTGQVGRSPAYSLGTTGNAGSASSGNHKQTAASRSVPLPKTEKTFLASSSSPNFCSWL